MLDAEAKTQAVFTASASVILRGSRVSLYIIENPSERRSYHPGRETLLAAHTVDTSEQYSACLKLLSKMV